MGDLSGNSEFYRTVAPSESVDSKGCQLGQPLPAIWSQIEIPAGQRDRPLQLAHPDLAGLEAGRVSWGFDPMLGKSQGWTSDNRDSLARAG